MRWPEKIMPLKVYIAPFRWYQTQKQQDSAIYSHCIAESLQIWANATNGKFSYQITTNYKESNMNVLWRRVDRQSLGLCKLDSSNECMIYSAEVEIGISDGIIHSPYQDINEVKHTVIHEIGHAIGLPHSPYPEDIMYVPHQYGIVNVSARDLNSAKWLYALEPGFNYQPFLQNWGLENNTSIDQLIWVYENQDKLAEMENQDTQNPSAQLNQDNRTLSIHEQQSFLANQNLFNLSLQHIKVDLNKRKKEIKKNYNPYIDK